MVGAERNPDMSESVSDLYQRAHKAFKTIEFWPQDKVDEMAAAVAWEWQKEETARAAVAVAMEEADMGIFEHKIAKQRNKVRGTMRDIRGVKTCGVIREIPEKGLKILAKPMGVVANVVPSTNPTCTPAIIGINLLKTRNAMIVSPHPRTKRSTNMTIESGRKALRKIGAPEDLLLCVKDPSHENTVELMSVCDFAVATGGAGLRKVVYGAGTPAQTTGAGNVVSIVDETADPKTVAEIISLVKPFDNGSGCSIENAIAIHDSIYEATMKALAACGGYLCSTPEREKLRAIVWPDGKTLNRDIVARSVQHIAGLASLTVPAATKFLMVVGEEIGPEDRFSGEKVSPILTVWRWSDFNEMLDRLDRILEFSGKGHSASIHSKNQARIMQLAERAHVGRISCNLPHGFANAGSWTSGQPFTASLGGGTWAGNMTSDNINWRHFLNYTWVASVIPEHVPTDEELFGDYFAKWGRD
ncbi:MAG TPA: aldehyde dehydrogenase [Planctomycetaceae bacterium]|nr:aldehyde dehydrogenase [Planctomycetaceae bacterium]